MVFNYLLPYTNLIFGEGSLKSLGSETKKMGKSALLVTGRSSMEKLGFLDQALRLLKKEDIEVFHYNKVLPNPTVEIVDEGARLALEKNCQVIIGMGGGSAMDTAKAIAVVAGHSKERILSIWEFSPALENPLPITEAALPVVAITSTSGTGSHVTRYAVVSNPETSEKPGFASEYMYPRLSIVDLNIVKTMPPELTARTGFDTLAHVLEAFISRKSNPITDLYCLKAIELITKYLPLAYQRQDDMEARYSMALADTYGGWAITAATAALPHAMSHPISGYYPDIDHGVALAAISATIMEFNIENGDQKTIQKYCQIAKAMGKQVKEYSKKEAKKSIEALKELCDKIGLTVSLGKLGVDRNKIPEMTKGVFRTMRRGVENNPVPVTESDVESLYNKSL